MTGTSNLPAKAVRATLTGLFRHAWPGQGWAGLGSAEPDWSLNQLDGAGVTGARALTLFDRPATGPISQAGKVDAVIYCPAVKAAHTNSRAGTMWGR